MKKLALHLRKKSAFHVVVARSTMLPGSMRTIVIPTLEEFSGKKAGVGFGVCINPEFLREGTAVFDYNHPPKKLSSVRPMRRQAKYWRHFTKKMDAPLILTDIETAEMVKYTDNTWHAVKNSIRQRNRQHLQSDRYRWP
ncbi:hypothetical protein ACFS07_02605 [Undibacterium arcticum]